MVVRVKFSQFTEYIVIFFRRARRTDKIGPQKGRGVDIAFVVDPGRPLQIGITAERTALFAVGGKAAFDTELQLHGVLLIEGKNNFVKIFFFLFTSRSKISGPSSSLGV